MARSVHFPGAVGYGVAQKLIRSRWVEGDLVANHGVAVSVDQVFVGAEAGPLVAMELETLGVVRVGPLCVMHGEAGPAAGDPGSAYLVSACRRFGIWYSPPANGASHAFHQERFAAPGRVLVGADGRAPALAAMGMLAIGGGALDAALAMAGEPLHFRMPRVRRIHLIGRLPEWVSARDLGLELLRRHGPDGSRGTILEYGGPGLRSLSAMDRHVLAVMGCELGATTSVFPSDGAVRRFLEARGRGDAWAEIAADSDAEYDEHEEIDLTSLEPLIALPGSPVRVVPVAASAGLEIARAELGPRGNPGYRDFAVAAGILARRRVAEGVSLDVVPSTREVFRTLVRDGHLESLLAAGARIRETAAGEPGEAREGRTLRSGSRRPSAWECLASPETVAASATTGAVTDPRTLGGAAPAIEEPPDPLSDGALLVRPEPSGTAAPAPPPERAPLPAFPARADRLEIPVLLKAGDDVSTDEIMPADGRIAPWHDRLPRIAEFSFLGLDPSYAGRARDVSLSRGHAVVAGRNYGWGPSVENAVLGPRYLGLRCVIAASFSRVHRRDLAGFGILALTLRDPAEHRRIERGDVLRIEGIPALRPGAPVHVWNATRQRAFETTHDLSAREIDRLRDGGLVGAWNAGSIEPALAASFPR